MPRPKDTCHCGNPKGATAAMCRECRDSTPYTRTAEHRAALSAQLTGKKKPPGYVPASKRQEVAAKISAYWTPERRAEKAAAVSNPDDPYRLHWRKRKALVQEAGGKCHRCGTNDPAARLGIHHKDRNKRNHALGNLEVLCNSCHALEHANAGEIGWSRYHALSGR